MRTIIMAAGTSQRLRPLTDTIPKTLLRLGEKTILEHILDAAVKAGLRHFDIVTGHGHSAVVEAADAYRAAHTDVSINLIFNDVYDSTGNIVSMRMAEEVFDEDFVLINSDTIFHADILKRLVESEAANAMIVDDVKKLGAEEMKVQLGDTAEHIVRIHKSLDPAGSHGEYIGVLKLSKNIKRQLLASLDKTIAKNNSVYYEDGLQTMINDFNIPIKPISTEGLPAMEIDTHEDLAAAEELIKKITMP